MKVRSRTRGRRAGKLGALTTADLVVLSLLAERPMHGYDLLSEYGRQEVVDWASVSKAQLYYALGKLAERGLIEGRSDNSGAARERTVYGPTSVGLEALGDALGDQAWSVGRQPQPFATWLGLSMHADPAAAHSILNGRRRWLANEIDRERASLKFIISLPGERAKRGADIVQLVIRQLEVELEWVSEMADRQ